MKVIIIGGGQVGSNLATLLLSNGHEVRLIEQSEKKYKKLLKEMPSELLILGNESDPEILKEAGIESADVVAAVSGADETNLVVSTLAKMEFRVPRVVSMVNNPKNAWLYNGQMGVDVCVNQAEIIAKLVVEDMDMKDMFTMLKLSNGDYSIIQINVGDDAKAANQYVKDLLIPQKTVLIAITRNGSVLIPKGDTQILVGDEILTLTDESSRKSLTEIF